MSMIEWVSSMSLPEPAQSRFQWFLISFVTLGSVSLFALWAVDIARLRIYLVAMFLSLLVTSEVFPPLADEQWWRRLQIVKIGGWLATLSLLFERVVAVI